MVVQAQRQVRRPKYISSRTLDCRRRGGRDGGGCRTYFNLHAPHLCRLEQLRGPESGNGGAVVDDSEDAVSIGGEGGAWIDARRGKPGPGLGAEEQERVPGV